MFQDLNIPLSNLMFILEESERWAMSISSFIFVWFQSRPMDKYFLCFGA